MEETNQVAVDAYNFLLVWVRGFRKNSKNTSRPIYVWQHEDEREEFAALTDAMRAAPYVQQNKIGLGAFPVKAPRPKSPGAAPPAASDTLSAVETLDISSSPPQDLTAAEHRHFLGSPPSLPPALEPEIVLEVSTQAGKTSTLWLSL